MALRLLYPNPPAGDDDQAKVDIIAVHGLNPKSKSAEDHAWDTWRSPEGSGGSLWLRDKLPGKVPEARIFLYVYDSTAVFGTNRATFIEKANQFLEVIHNVRDDHPTRPLLLLGHSLGGLLIKQAIVQAFNNKRYEDIILSTKGLVFFATPHGGAVGKVAANIARAIPLQKGGKIIEVLERGTLFTDLVKELFRQRLLDFPLVSFWGDKDRYVSRENASIGLPGDHENIVQLGANHSKVCKFGDTRQDEDNLAQVIPNIQQLYKKAITPGESVIMPDAPVQDLLENAPFQDDLHVRLSNLS